MTCDHTAGVHIAADLLFELDDLSGMNAHRYVLDVTSIVCRTCGRPFTVGDAPGIALRLQPEDGHPGAVSAIGPIVDAADFECV